jgi:hypothetical protein
MDPEVVRCGYPSVVLVLYFKGVKELRVQFVRRTPAPRMSMMYFDIGSQYEEE